MVLSKTQLKNLRKAELIEVAEEMGIDLSPYNVTVALLIDLILLGQSGEELLSPPPRPPSETVEPGPLPPGSTRIQRIRESQA